MPTTLDPAILRPLLARRGRHLVALAGLGGLLIGVGLYATARPGATSSPMTHPGPDAVPALSWAPSIDGTMPRVGPADRLILRQPDATTARAELALGPVGHGREAMAWHRRSLLVLAAATAARDDGQLEVAWAGALRLVGAAGAARGLDPLWRAVTASRAEQASRLLDEVWRHPDADGPTRARWAVALAAVQAATRTEAASTLDHVASAGATRWRLAVEDSERRIGQVAQTILIGAVEAP